MALDKNFVSRAVDALVAGRERRARQIVERFERDRAKMNGELTKR